HGSAALDVVVGDDVVEFTAQPGQASVVAHGHDAVRVRSVGGVEAGVDVVADTVDAVGNSGGGLLLNGLLLSLFFGGLLFLVLVLFFDGFLFRLLSRAGFGDRFGRGAIVAGKYGHAPDEHEQDEKDAKTSAAPDADFGAGGHALFRRLGRGAVGHLRATGVGHGGTPGYRWMGGGGAGAAGAGPCGEGRRKGGVEGGGGVGGCRGSGAERQ